MNLPLTVAALSLTCISSIHDTTLEGGNYLGDASSWQTVLDGVMGGRSSGEVRATDTGTLSFTGKLSLENNGGFSQMRRAIDGDELAGSKGVVLECRGDGRTYNFDIRVSNARMMAGGFQKKFDTTAGQWTTIELPYEDFRLFSFGRRMRNAPKLDPTRIESFGVTLSDKNPGNFALELRAIRTFSDADRSVNAGANSKSGNDLVSVAKAAGLTTLLDLVTASGIKLPKTPVTIFAPTNAAFAKLPKATLKELLKPESRGKLRQILAYHIVAGARTSADVLNSRSLKSLIEQPLKVNAQTGRIADASIVAVDVSFDGGIVHVIDSVLLPEQRSITQLAAATKDLSTLVTAVKAAQLASQLGSDNGPWTVFAPINSAFAKLPKGTLNSLLERSNRRALTEILGLHVVPGRVAASELLAKKRLTTLMGQPITASLKNGKVTIDGANIVTADIPAQNGVIHLIDTVVLPKAEPTIAPAASIAAKATTSIEDLKAAGRNLYEMAVKEGVAQFNAGNTEACAAIYAVTIESVLSLTGTRLPNVVRMKLEEGKQAASEATSPRTRAWILRRVLDDTYEMLERAPTRQREEIQREKISRRSGER